MPRNTNRPERGTGYRCGTTAGANDHRRNGTTCCQACRDAVNAHRAALRGQVTAVVNTAFVINPDHAGAVSRRFGVEIEFRSGVTQAAVQRELRNRGLAVEVEAYNHHVRSHWKITTDGSCGYELVSPPLQGEQGIAQLLLACEALAAAGVRQDDSCGIHVHVEARDLTLAAARRLLRSYRNAQGGINAVVEPQRRDTYYTRPLAEGRLAQASRAATLQDLAGTWDRYQVVNLASWTRYGTVEFRQFHATTNGQQVADWTRLMIALTDVAMAGGTFAANTSLNTVLAAGQDHGLTATAAARLATVSS